MRRVTDVVCALAISTPAGDSASSFRPVSSVHASTLKVNGVSPPAHPLSTPSDPTLRAAFKIPFCIQWVWPPFLIALVWFAPESPFWLVRQQRYADAEASVRRLTSVEYFSDEDVKKNVAMKIHTTELEKQMSAGASYIDMFKGIDRRRTEIVSSVRKGGEMWY